MYLDVVREALGRSVRYLVVRMDNTYDVVKDHKPYFYVGSKGRVTVDTIRSIVREQNGKEELVMNVVDVVEIDAKMLVFDETYKMFYIDPEIRVYKVVCENPALTGDVGRLVSAVMFAGAFNVRYLVRLSFDIVSNSLFGVRTPAIFFPIERAEKMLSGGLKTLRGRKIVAFDIEVRSEGSFPRPGDPLLSISIYTFRFLEDFVEGDEEVVRASRDAYVIDVSHGRSSDMVLDFIKEVDKARPIAVVGWNSASFDVVYMKPHLPSGSSTVYIGASHIRFYNRVYPHIDLFLMRSSMGSSLGVRSQASFALDDVATDLGIIDPHGEVATIEASVDRSNMAYVYTYQRELFGKYVRYDVVLTGAIAMRWLPILYALSICTGIAPSVIQMLNVGQVFEYVTFVRYLEMLKIVPMLRRRKYDYGKMAGMGSVYGRGKVYASGYGMKKNVVVIDFSAMYPTIMYVDRVDPLSVVVVEQRSIDGSERSFRIPYKNFLSMVEDKGMWIVLGTKTKKSSDVREPKVFAYVVTTYSILQFPIANARFLRLHMKKLKKGCRDEVMSEIYGAIDKALKIFINSGYGGMSKKRGNILNEYASAYIFYRSNLIQMIPAMIIDVVKELSLRGELDATLD